MHPLRTVPRRLLAGSGALLLGTALATAAIPVPANAATRRGHRRIRPARAPLPDTPAVDVYLAAPGAAKPQVFPGVGYGVVSDYLAAAPGRYAVAMRKAGAPASEPPVLTTEVAVTAGDAYTVAGVGRHADLGLRVLNDDLERPRAGPGQGAGRAGLGPDAGAGRRRRQRSDHRQRRAVRHHHRLPAGRAGPLAAAAGGGTGRHRRRGAASPAAPSTRCWCSTRSRAGSPPSCARDAAGGTVVPARRGGHRRGWLRRAGPGRRTR